MGAKDSDRRRWASGHGDRSDDRAGVGTVMITGGAVPAPRYTITGVSPCRHAATRDFAEALGHQPLGFVDSDGLSGDTRRLCRFPEGQPAVLIHLGAPSAARPRCFQTVELGRA